MRIVMLDENELNDWLLEGESLSDDELKGIMFRLIGDGMLPEGVDEEHPRVQAFVRRCALVNGKTPPEWAQKDMFAGVRTGRLDSSKPNFSNTPKADRPQVMHCLDADEGEG
jgi:hypothetical protein